MLATLAVLILDFDGVVIESNDVKTRAFETVFAQFSEQRDVMMTFHHEHVSVSRFAKFDHLAGLLGRADDAALKEGLAADFSRSVREQMLTVPLVPGAESFLKQAKMRFPVYLASVTPEPELKWILEQRDLTHWFDGVYGCPPWTKPNAIRDILLKERVEASSAMLIGDSAGDQRAAQETGVSFLARDSGLTFDEPGPLAFADLNEISLHLKDFLHE